MQDNRKSNIKLNSINESIDEEPESEINEENLFLKD